MSSRGRVCVVGSTLCMLASLAACAKVQEASSGLGDTAVESIRDVQPQLYALEKSLADSAGAYLGRAIEREVLSRAELMWDTLLVKAEAGSDRIVTEVAANVQYDVSRSLQLLIDETLDLAERRGSQLVEKLIASAMLEATRSVDTLVSTAMSSLSVGLEEDLRPVVVDVVNVLADSLVDRIREVDEALAQSQTVSTVRSTFLYFALGAGAVLIAVAAIIATATIRRQRKSLNVLVDAIDEAGDKPLPNLRADIKSRAQEVKVQGFLTDLVNKRRQERQS